LTDTANPVRVFFGTELRRTRDKAGLTQEQLAEKLGCTPGWISTMESGRKISEQSAKDLDTFFRADEHFHGLWKLANDIEVTTALPPGFPEYIDLEGRSAEIYKFEALSVTGLLQTKEYAREVLLTVQQPHAVEPLMAKRMERQALLTRDNAPRLFVVHDERALRTILGDEQVMRDQLRHLLDISQYANIQHQVVPQSTGGYAGIEGGLTLLKLDGGREAAYIEAQGQGQLIQDPVRVANCAVRYNLLRGYALSVPETQRLIESILESL
jgi:transcriptional regulator with XRE-family HTH domain